MNKVILMGRLTRDPHVTYSGNNNSMAIVRYTLAVDRRIKREEGQAADFISCVAFGKSGEFAEKYFRQGQRVLITGRLQTGSYVNKEGTKVYTTEVIIDEQEFADGKRDSNVQQSTSYDNALDASQDPTSQDASIMDGFMQIPDGVENEGLPFN